MKSLIERIKQIFGVHSVDVTNPNSTTSPGYFYSDLARYRLSQQYEAELYSLLDTSSKIRLHIGDQILIVTGDLQIIGIHNYVPGSTCGNFMSPSEYLRELKKFIDKEIMRCGWKSLIRKMSDKKYLLNVADKFDPRYFLDTSDRVDPDYFSEKIDKYNKYVKQKLDLVYPLIRSFLKEYKSDELTINYEDKGWTSTALPHLIKLLSDDGYHCNVNE